MPTNTVRSTILYCTLHEKVFVVPPGTPCCPTAKAGGEKGSTPIGYIETNKNNNVD